MDAALQFNIKIHLACGRAGQNNNTTGLVAVTAIK